jgi:hypothetical protein
MRGRARLVVRKVIRHFDERGLIVAGSDGTVVDLWFLLYWVPDSDEAVGGATRDASSCGTSSGGGSWPKILAN